MTGGNSFRYLVLVGMAALNKPHRRNRRKYPGQLADFGDIGLYPEDTFFRIKAERQKISGSLKGSLAQPIAVLNRCKGMEINNKNVEFGTFHMRDHGFHHSEIVPYMQFSRGLNP